jgi:soluble lytic murein transglycosylase
VLRVLSVLFLGAWVPAVAAAGGQGVWGLETEEFRRRVQHGDYAFLRHLNYDELDLSEIHRVGDGASYYTGRVLLQLDMAEPAAKLLRLAERETPDPWSRRAAIELVSYLREHEDYEMLEAVAGPFRGRYPDEPLMALAYMEALYEQDEYGRVLEAVEASSADVRARPDTLLWEGVSAYRTGSDRWREAFDELFYEHPARIQQSRVYLFIATRESLQSQYSGTELALFRGKHVLSEGRAREAFIDFRGAVEQLASAAPLTDAEKRRLAGSTIRDVAIAGLVSNRLTDGIALLGRIEELLPEASADTRARIDEYQGRLALARGSAGEARRWLGSALAAATSDAERVRRVRYYLQALVQASPTEAALSIGGHISSVENPARFDHMLEKLSAQLVADRQWSALLAAYRSIADVEVPESISQYAVVLAAAARRGLMSLPEDISAEQLLHDAARRRESPYYAFLASAMLGSRGEGLLIEGAAPAPFEPDANTERYVAGYFDFGLMETGYQAARRYREELPPAAFLAFSEQLAEHGEVANSMRLADVLFRDPEHELSRQLLELRFPHAFHQPLSSVADQYDLPVWVFYGLVREESYFQPRVGSHAGAVGLTQLMPATAEEMAGRLRLVNAEITDPATNLQIGGYYLQYLRDRFGALTQALLAYNAGPTRLRRWNAGFGDLSGLLFVEAVPFVETRNYLRKVLVSAVYYSYLYGNSSVEDTVTLFFPRIAETGEG